MRGARPAADLLKKNKRQIDRAIRDLDRERVTAARECLHPRACISSISSIPCISKSPCQNKTNMASADAPRWHPGHAQVKLQQGEKKIIADIRKAAKDNQVVRGDHSHRPSPSHSAGRGRDRIFRREGGAV